MNGHEFWMKWGSLMVTLSAVDDVALRADLKALVATERAAEREAAAKDLEGDHRRDGRNCTDRQRERQAGTHTGTDAYFSCANCARADALRAKGGASRYVRGVLVDCAGREVES